MLLETSPMRLGDAISEEDFVDQLELLVGSVVADSLQRPMCAVATMRMARASSDWRRRGILIARVDHSRFSAHSELSRFRRTAECRIKGAEPRASASRSPGVCTSCLGGPKRRQR